MPLEVFAIVICMLSTRCAIHHNTRQSSLSYQLPSRLSSS